jgi:hypothetical protein
MNDERASLAEVAKAMSRMAGLMGQGYEPYNYFDVFSYSKVVGDFQGDDTVFRDEVIYRIEYYDDERLGEIAKWFSERGLKSSLEEPLGYSVETSDRELVMLAKLTWGGK